jgi:hypothetical protein
MTNKEIKLIELLDKCIKHIEALGDHQSPAMIKELKKKIIEENN